MGECVQWSDLPEDLVEGVVTRLPLPSVFKLRSTCRTWNDLVASRDLLARGGGGGGDMVPPTPCLLGASAADCEAFAGYNPVSRTWYDLFLAFPDPALRQKVYLAGSAGGLLCFAATIERAAAFFVCNPAARRWRQLPPPAMKVLPRMGFGHQIDLATCMVFDQAQRQYKIIVVGNAAFGLVRTTQIYFSRSDSWTRLGGAIPQDVDFRSYGLVCNGRVYYMMAGWSIKVMRVNVEDGAWSKLEAPLPRFLVRPHLVERNGSLLLVGGVHKYWRQGWNLLKPQSLRIWELDQTNLVWVEVARMPEDIHSRFVATLGDNVQDFKCTGSGNLMYFTSRSSSGFSVTLFDLGTNSWTWIPFPEKGKPVDDVVIFQTQLSPRI